MTTTTPNLLSAAERQLCVQALDETRSIVRAAEHLGITRHALKRRIVKYRIPWPPAEGATDSVRGP